MLSEGEPMKKLLIVYYSWSKGNTKKIAEMLQSAAGADIEAIETVQPYAGSYDDVVEQAQKEVKAGFQPEIKKLSHDLAAYDVIAVGTPTWWYTMAPAVSSFFSGHDLSGKTVCCFMTNAGWPGHVIRDMRKAAGSGNGPDMEVRFDAEGGDQMVTPQYAVEEWIKKVQAALQ